MSMVGRKKYISHLSGAETSRQAAYYTIRYKQMEYSNRISVEVLARGKYKGYSFLILSLGTHPTAYVGLPMEHKYFGKDYNNINKEDTLIVHGGFTYSKESVSMSNLKDKWWLGWDYAHLGDYTGFSPTGLHGRGGKQWTREEVLEDVKEVIKQLDVVKNNK